MMKTRFISFENAVKEYCAGDTDALTEAALLQPIMAFVRLPPVAVRLGPPGESKTKSEVGDALASFPVEKLVGWYPISAGAKRGALTRGASTITFVWYRDHASCTPETCNAKSYFENSYDAAHDRQAWLDIAGEALVVKPADLWFSRRGLERGMGQHFSSPDSGATGWPWGEHETTLLRHLAAAADRFWKYFDPTDNTTAPTNEVVTEWLKGRGVAERTAQVMASILRADGLPTGPRK